MLKVKKIGILGGGQLARMSSFAAFRLGLDTVIIEKERNSPAGILTKNEIEGWVENKEKLQLFADLSDIVTLENEFIDYSYLEFIEKTGKKVIPSSKTIRLIQDKYIQKKSLSESKIPLPKFCRVDSIEDFQEIKRLLKLPFVLKSRKMGYDGYGNALIVNQKKFEEAFERLTQRHSSLLAEEYIDFSKEIAIMTVRTKTEKKTYPVVETVQKNHICYLTAAPARIDEDKIRKAKKISEMCVEAVNGIGLFGVEMFLTKKGKILVNEIAPRPHNSGHYTIEACYTSQFENHIRAVLGLPLGSVEMITSAAVMVNLLGKKNGEGIVDNYAEALKNEKYFLHIYGKSKSRLGRKMGHITLLGDNVEKLIKKGVKIEKTIWI